MSDKTIGENLQDASDSLKAIKREVSFIKGVCYGILFGSVIGFSLGLLVQFPIG